MRGARAGFTIFEVLAALLLLSVAMVGVVLAFANYSRRYAQQDLRMTLDQNLRQGMDMMGDTLRTAGYGVPGASLANWITWVGTRLLNVALLSYPWKSTSVVSVEKPSR